MLIFPARPSWEILVVIAQPENIVSSCLWCEAGNLGSVSPVRKFSSIDLSMLVVMLIHASKKGPDAQCFITYQCVFMAWTDQETELFPWSNSQLAHLGLTLFCRFPPGPIRQMEGFATHICVTREMRAVFHDAYMRHQAKMKGMPSCSVCCSF